MPIPYEQQCYQPKGQKMSKINFDPTKSDRYEVARAIVIERLRNDKRWEQFDTSGSGFDKYVEYIGPPGNGKEQLKLLAIDILWELMIQGILAPGSEGQNIRLPVFHVTDYGRIVLEKGKFLPNDPVGYIERINQVMKRPDDTILTYLSESLECFNKNCFVSAVILLGVASEREFLLLCESLLNALTDTKERAKFNKILDKRAIKPKFDWVFNKIQAILHTKSHSLPENLNIMLTVIFDFIRRQRNELGHPQERPPSVSREEVFVNLNIFPDYLKTVDQVIAYLNNNKV
jgi:hypothetical protein